MNTHSVSPHFTSPLRVLTAALVLALGCSAAGTADAHPRTRVGVWIGAPWAFGPGYWGPGYWGPGYGYGYGYGGYYGYAPPPATVIVQPAPGTGNVAPAVAQQAQSWYYCQTSQMYYPHVRDCAVDWQEVPVASAPPSTPEPAAAPRNAGSEAAPPRAAGTPVPRGPTKPTEPR